MKVPAADAHGRIPPHLTPYGPGGVRSVWIGADTTPQDDHWFFSVERADPRPALLVHSDGDSASPLYVKTALESATDAAFTIESETPVQAANATLSKFAFVILSDPGPLPAKLAESLSTYVHAGGSMLVALGHNAIPGGLVPVADVLVTAIHTIAPDTEAVQSVAQMDTSCRLSSQAPNWDSVQIFQYVKLQAPPSDPDVRVAAKMANGLPLLVDHKIGEGARGDLRLGLRQYLQ